MGRRKKNPFWMLETVDIHATTKLMVAYGMLLKEPPAKLKGYPHEDIVRVHKEFLNAFPDGHICWIPNGGGGWTRVVAKRHAVMVAEVLGIPPHIVILKEYANNSGPEKQPPAPKRPVGRPKSANGAKPRESRYAKKKPPRLKEELPDWLVERMGSPEYAEFDRWTVPRRLRGKHSVETVQIKPLYFRAMPHKLRSKFTALQGWVAREHAESLAKVLGVAFSEIEETGQCQ